MSQQLTGALFSQLVRLMKHIIKWNSQPERRYASWVAFIDDARKEMEAIQVTKPSLNYKHIESIWPKAFEKAARQDENETGASDTLTALHGKKFSSRSIVWRHAKSISAANHKTR